MRLLIRDMRRETKDIGNFKAWLGVRGMLGDIFLTSFCHAWERYLGYGLWRVGSCQTWTLNSFFKKFCVRLILISGKGDYLLPSPSQ